MKQIDTTGRGQLVRVDSYPGLPALLIGLWRTDLLPCWMTVVAYRLEDFEPMCEQFDREHPQQ